MTRIIRPFRPHEAAVLGRVFYRAVHEGAAEAYTARQRAAWAPDPPEGPVWETRLSAAYTLVAETDQGALEGFMSLTPDGMIDLAYVLPEARGTGTAQEIYRAIEDDALRRGLDGLRTDASHPARRFFLKQGWHVLAEQQPVRQGVRLTNFRMEKRLGTD